MDNALNIRIDRVKFFGNLLRFQLNIQTDNPEFRSPSFTVIRIYKDFAWLDDKLRDNKQYLGISLPKLPPKLMPDENMDHFTTMQSSLSKLSIKSQERFEEEMSINKSHEMELCKQSHQRYLDELSHHNILRNDPFFKIFLEYRDLLKGVVKRKKNTLYREMDGLVESYLDNDFDKYQFRGIYDNCIHIKDMILLNSAVTYACENMCYSIAGFSVHLDEVGWNNLSLPLWTLTEEIRRGNQNMKQVFINTIYLNYEYASAQKYLILGQYYGLPEYDELKDYYQTTHYMIDELDRLQSQSEDNYKSAFSVLSSFQLASSRAIENNLRQSIKQLSNN